MNTYMIPREATDENRFLFFTKESLIFTLVGFIFGVFIKLIVEFFFVSSSSPGWLPYALWGICVVFGGIGYVLGAFNLPESNAFDFLRKAGGEPVYVIVKRIIKFNKRKKIYIYERS